MIIKSYKKQTGWGKWSVINVYKCKCGHEMHMVKNWSGPKPPGAFRCAKCENNIAI